ncbi:MAG: Hsp20/alpha crystallin family protein [Nitrospirae bacterium]|nr:Hsp20/alpha crystallin family protein [Nitrospirota bacterium]
MTFRDIVPSFGKKRVPVRYESRPFGLLTEDVNKMFDSFFHGFDTDLFGGRTGPFSPNVEVSENEKEIRVAAELPGLDEKDIDIILTDDALTISGEKKEETESSGKDFFMKERTYGSFSRSIPLYSEVQTDKVNAHFKKGVLTVTLPKSEKETESKKKITVKIE